MKLSEHEKQRCETLVQEALDAAFQGWDFAYVSGYGSDTEEPLEWCYKNVVREHAAGCDAMVDLGTGGGEFLTSLPPLPPNTYATESYPPNIKEAIVMIEHQQYTKVIGEKFHKNGSVRTFPGNTVISKIPDDLPIYAGLVEAQKRLKAIDTSGKYAFLPPSSLHMTVMEGLCDQVRIPERWSQKLDLHKAWGDVNQFMFDCFSRMSPPHSLTMRIAGFSFSRWPVLVLEPANPTTAHSLQDFREQFSLETGIRFPNHETYTYHISLAYNLIVLTDDDERLFRKTQQELYHALSATYPIIELAPPRLTYFENMFRFDDAC